MTLKTFIENTKPLFWDIKASSLDSLSKTSVLERVLMYGDIADYKKLEEILSKKDAQRNFEMLASKKRCNIAPQTINLFKIHFQ